MAATSLGFMKSPGWPRAIEKSAGPIPNYLAGKRWGTQGEIITDEGDGGTKLAAFLAARKFI